MNTWTHGSAVFHLCKGLLKCQGDITGRKHFSPLKEIVLNAHGFKNNFHLVA